MREEEILFNGNSVKIGYFTKIENTDFKSDVPQKLPPSLFIGTNDADWFHALETGSNHTIEHAGMSYQARLIAKDNNALELHFSTTFENS